LCARAERATVSLLSTIRDVVAIARRAQVSMLAAGLAYFAFTSLFPLALLAVVLITAVGGDALAERVMEVAVSTLGDQVGEIVTTAVFAQEARLPSTVLGVVVLLWSSLRLFRSFDAAFATIYRERAERSLLRRFANAVVVLATNLLALSLLGAIAVLFGFRIGPAPVVAPIALFSALVVVFLPMFYVFPEPDVTVREVLPGTVLAAGAWAVASVAFGVYAGVSSLSTYGVASTALLLLTWLYVGGLAVRLRGDPVFVTRVERAEELRAIGLGERQNHRVHVVRDENVLQPREPAESFDLTAQFGPPVGDGCHGRTRRLLTALDLLA
jgi:YihY family inner membrane protein